MTTRLPIYRFIVGCVVAVSDERLSLLFDERSCHIVFDRVFAQVRLAAKLQLPVGVTGGVGVCVRFEFGTVPVRLIPRLGWLVSDKFVVFQILVVVQTSFQRLN